MKNVVSKIRCVTATLVTEPLCSCGVHKCLFYPIAKKFLKCSPDIFWKENLKNAKIFQNDTLLSEAGVAYSV